MTYSLCHILLKIIFVKYVSGEFLSSLTFVIDDTSSMSDDIDAVKKGTSQIFDTVLRNRDESQIDNFILVTFNDHSWDSWCASSERGILRAKTKEEYVFKNALAGIYVNDGGIDCAECSMAGIKRGLEESLPRSNVYVFTDASAKDYHRYEEVKKFALEKGSQIVFVLTGMCKGGTTSPSYRVYEDIARETGGEVFHIDKYSVDKVLDYVKETIKGRLYEVNTTLVSPGPNIITLNIDALMGEVFLTLSSTTTNHHSVRMTDPDGIEVYKRIVFTTDKSSSYAFNATKSGRHSVVVNTAVKARAKLAVRSAVEFGHGFSSIAVDSLMDTSSMPAPGAKTHLLIQLSKGDIALKTVKLLDIYNNLIQELRLNVLDNATKLYMTEEFEPPKVTFKVEITGYDAKSDSTIVRRGSTGSTVDTISSGETMTNKPATVVIKDAPKINAKYNEQLKLTCKVEGYPKPDIVWKNEAEGITYSTETKPGKNHRYDYVNVLTIEKVTENATYTCEAKNSYSDSKQIVVEVIRPRHLNILSKTENITVEYEREGKMICVVDAYPSVEISWYRDGRGLSPGGNVELLVSHELLDKSVLTIKNSTLSDEGKYTCVARNEDTNMSIDVYYTIIGLEEPEIYKIVSNASVIKGLNTTIDCKILKGKPKPTISWYLGTTSISPLKVWENQEQIVIADAHETDSGKYICQAKNEVGIDQHEVQLLVEVPATIKPPRQLNLALLVGNKKSTLNCQTRGIPKPEIKWIYQSFDTSLSPKEMTEHKEKERLNLENVQLSHEGYYTCVSSNSAGSSQITFNVTVLERPEIYKIVKKASVVKGLKTTIDCIILKGKPKPTISWYLGTTSTSPLKVWENQEQIVIADAHETDSGKYICQAKNEVGVDKHEVQLIVEVPATIKPPRQLNLALLVGNKKSTLNCQTRGIPKPEIKWIYQSFDTSLPPKEMTEHKEKERLNLENVQLSHEGYYTCVSSNSAGSTQITFNVTVLERPEIYKIVNKASVIKGLKTTIDCIILKGKPKPTISWYLGTTSTSPLKVWENQEQIVIEDAHETDSGKYICQAKNEVGVDKHEVQLIVEVPATIKPPRQLNLALLVGNTKSTLNCQTRGIPKPEIKWIYQSFDTSLPPKEMTEYKEKEWLNLDNVQLSHEGYYTCVSSNSAGSSQITFNVTVLERPEIYKIVNKASVIKGLKTTIDCIILKGKPKPTISWYLGTTSISPLKDWENQEQIVIADAHETDSGKYICQAKNEVGVDKHEVQLLVEVPASIKPPRQLNLALLVGNTKSTLNCQTRGIPKPEIKWIYQSFDTSLSPKEMTEHKEKERLNLENVQLSHEGYYTCVSSNSAGSSQITFNVTVLERPEIYKIVNKASVIKGLKTTIDCIILKGKPKPTISWYLGTTSTSPLKVWENQEQIVIADAHETDSGKYICQAKNEVGVDKHEVQLLVEVPASIKPPRQLNLALLVGNTKSTLNCQTRGIPKPEIKWIYQSFDTSLPPKEMTEHKDKERLNLENVQLSHEGYYTCVSSNSAGSSQITFNVTVLERPEIYKIVNKASVIKGLKTTIDCIILKGKPKPKISWYLGSTSTSPLKDWENKEQIVIADAHETDSGKYICQAKNEVGVDKHEVQLLVEVPASIKPPRQLNLALLVGNTKSTLNCQTRGIPKPEIKWIYQSFDTSLSPKEMTEHKEKERLNLENVQLSHEGYYTCVSSNSAGSSQITFNVTVLERPEIYKIVNKASVVKGLKTTIDCIILKGKPKPTISWYLETTSISPLKVWENQEQIVIADAHEKDSGKYICQAKNEVGVDKHEVQLLVKVPASIKPPRQLNLALLVGNTKSTLNCQTRGIPKPEIKWIYQSFDTSLSPKEMTEHKEKERLNLENVQLSHEGYYTCVSSNSAGSSQITFNVTVLERPEIYKIVNKVSVIKGLKTTIDCIILKGKPKPTISWYLGTTSTSPLKVWENQEQIVIADAHETDSGKYICQAKNEVGVDKHEVQLLVEVPATIKPPRQLNLALLVGNTKSTLNCQTRGIPKPEIKWIYQSFDTSLPPKEMTEHKEKERLNLENVQLSHEGYYTCVSSNSAGSSQITFNVTVLERPEIYKIVNKASVIKGLKTTIDCIILKGKPKPTISWYLGTTSISPLKDWENQEQIVIADAHETDSGKYICQAKNEVGVDKHEVQLLVEVPATIKPPRQLNLTLLVGNIKSALNCQTRGIPKPEIKWFYQSFDTSLPPKEMTEHKEKERLNLENVQLSHEGYYTCVSSNSAGSSQITFNVTVLEAPLIYKPNITDIHVDLGTNQVLECKILKGKPKPSITWYFRFGRKDDDSSTHFVEKPEWNDQESIVVEKVAKEDTGTYQCRVYNSVSTVYIDTTLIVDYPPKVKTRANFLKAKEKSKVSIPCSADGSPPPDITWLKDGVQLFNDSKYTIRPESLRFDAQLTVGGNYTCIATNRLGSDFKTVRVYVSGPATIAMPNTTSFSLAVGSGVVLPCENNGYPVPTIRWTYQSFGTRTSDEKILKHFENNLHLKNIQVSEAGYYTCTAVNTGSIANLTYEVQVFAPPKIVNTYKENIFVAVEGDLVLKIDCNVTGDPIPEITWTLNDLNLALGSIYHIQNGTLFIYDVPEDASGVYKCEVENARGKDLVSYEVIVQKYPPFTRPVSQVFIREHQSQGIKCPLPHTLTDGLRWYKDQVLICKGELVISEATQRDTGNYICRVSTLEKTHNSAVEVIVGDAPEFKTVVNENINMVEGLPVTLNCETESIPEGNIKWYHGDEELNATNAIYYFPTGLKSPGVYKCNVVNRFGSISRTFRASQSYCVLESSVLMMNNKAAPLMLSSNLTWLTPEKSDQNLIISKDTQVIFFCPNKFIKFPKKYILSFCDGGANFLIDGVKYEYSHIKCAENMEHTVQRTHTNCMLGEMDTEFIKLGYNVFGDVFTPVYEVCFNKTSEIPIYTKLTIQKSLANDTYSESSWSDDEQFKMDFEEAYICEDQVKSISRSLGKWFHNRDECCFSKRQLVSPKDVFPGVPQKSTFSYFNVVPQWGTCNGQNWDEVEQRVRNYATKFENLLVWTGIAEQLSLPKLSYGKWADIFITDSRRKRQPVPLFLWKVIQNPVNMSSLAIIQVNKPDFTEDEVSTGEYTRCRDVCDDVQWMRNFYWQDVNRGYIYCCKLDEFENAFGFKGVFEPEMYDLPI